LRFLALFDICIKRYEICSVSRLFFQKSSDFLKSLILLWPKLRYDVPQERHRLAEGKKRGMIDSLYRLLGRMGFTDPLHPPIVHIPIGLVIGALVFFAIGALFRRKRLFASARQVSILALVFVFPTILLGVFDWIHFFHGAMIPAIQIKMILAGVLLVLLGAGIIVGGEEKPHAVAMSVIYLLSVVAVIALGYFGASLVYGRGAAAARSSTIGVSEAPPPTAGIASEGESLFAANCRSCHAGGGNAIEPRLPVRGSRRLASLESFEAFLRAPSMPDGRPGAMPAFGADSLQADRVKELYDFVTKEFR